MPVAALGFAFFHHGGVFATGGLETMMFTFFVTAGLILTIVAERNWQFCLAGTTLILGSMTRPDGALLYAVHGVLVAIICCRQRRLAPTLWFGLPFVVLFIPFFWLKFAYYGHPVPNTAYAKSASRPYVEQGLRYVGVFFLHYLILVPVVVAALLVPIARRTRGLAAGMTSLRAPLLAAAQLFLYLSYVIWVGGDFMFARFCVPFVPAMLVALQVCIGGRSSLLAVGTTVGLIGGLAFAATRIEDGALQKAGYREKYHIGDSPMLYRDYIVEANRRIGSKLRDYLYEADPVIAISGGEAMLAYYIDTSEIIERYGLTDAYIARRPIGVRGKIGHEKGIGLDDPYLLTQRKVSLVFSGFLAYHPELCAPSDRIGERRHIEFFVKGIQPGVEPPEGWWVKGNILTYRRSVMAKLRGKAGIRFIDFERYLDDYLEAAADKPRQDIEADYRAFCRFYFDHNDDQRRQAEFRRLLGS